LCGRAGGDEGAGGVAGEGLDFLGAAEDADEAPDGVVVDGCGLAGAPDKADHGEAFGGVEVEEVLLVAICPGCGEVVGQPVGGGDELGEQLTAMVEDFGLGGGGGEEGLHVGDETGEGGGLGVGDQRDAPWATGRLVARRPDGIRRLWVWVGVTGGGKPWARKI